ncbi:MAG: spermidine/putrescine transport system permease protein [Alphaproteobacteria bacterium]|jgi:ABC-type Fe3+ transport system permease subunit|nr:spermidine/putrescine transport system permease protein [Alphaproteobacteria bacterium]
MAAVDRSLNNVAGGPAIVVAVVLGAAALIFVVAPVAITVIGAFLESPRPGGFGMPALSLARLAENTVLMSITGAAIALGVAVLASSIAVFDPRFHRYYRAWLLAMLFTNPVFLVLGLSTLLAAWPPFAATTAATAYVVLPLGGLVVQSAFEEFPRVQINAALSLGASPSEILWGLVLPASRDEITLGGLLMAIYAMGFYLLPSYVGLGRTPTLATAMSTLIAQLGDWRAAQQIAILLIGLELLVLLGWWILGRVLRRSGKSP